MQKEYEKSRWLSKLERRRGRDQSSENLLAVNIETQTEASGSSVLRRDGSREMFGGKKGKKVKFGSKERFPPLANPGSRADKIEEPKQESSDRRRRQEVEGGDDFEEMLNRNRKYFE